MFHKYNFPQAFFFFTLSLESLSSPRYKGRDMGVKRMRFRDRREADASRPLTSNYNVGVTLIIRNERRDRSSPRAGFLFIRDPLDWTIKVVFAQNAIRGWSRDKTGLRIIR